MVLPAMTSALKVVPSMSRCTMTIRTMASGKDPIQQMFLDKIAEYRKLAASAPGGLVGADANIQKAVKEDAERVKRTYGVHAGGEDVLTTKFSDENFSVDSIHMKEWK